MEPKVTEALNWIIGIFEKYNVQYQIAGGVAARLYGATRPINDIDIDIPRKNFEYILPDVREYITYGPTQFLNEKWDIYEMMLKYHGQEIDITAEEANIFDDNSQKWIPSNADLTRATIIPFNNLLLRVCPRQELINYKKLLNGAHQKQDIAEITL